jgi:hypothetical protein
MRGAVSVTLNRVWIPSPCYHNRSNNPRLIVLHTAEGARTIEDLGHFFQNYNNQVSSHVGADDKLGKIGEYVKPGNAAWTQANYNNAAMSMELCGFASWSTDTWKNDHHNMLQNCADWIRETSNKHDIPITKLTAGQAQGSGRGVCQHRDLGAGGGGHTDCGNGFPMDYVLDLARGKAPPAETTEEDEDMFYLTFDADGIAPVVIPRQYRQGKGRLVFYSNTGCRIRMDWPNGSPVNMTDVDLGYEQNSQGGDIPKDINACTIRKLDAIDATIAGAFFNK